MKSPLRAERERRKWSLKKVAKDIGGAVTDVQISRIELGGLKSARTVKKLVKHFGGAVSLEAICFPEDFAVPEPAAEQEAS